MLQWGGWVGCCGLAFSTAWLPFWPALGGWIGTLMLWLSVCWWCDRRFTQAPAPSAGSAGWVTTGLLLVGALAVRLWDLGGFPGALLNDETKFGTVALQIMDGTLSTPFGTTYRAHPTLFSVFQALALEAGGFSIASLRLPAALLGAAAVAAVHRLGRRLWGPTAGTWAAILLATLPLHLHFSRLGLNNSADSTLGALIGATLLWALATQARMAWAALGVALGLCGYAYPGARLLPLLVLAGLGFWWNPLRRSRPELGRALLLGGASAVLTILPLGLALLGGAVDPGQPMLADSVLGAGTVPRVARELGLSQPQFWLHQLKVTALALWSEPDAREFYRVDGGLIQGFTLLWFSTGALAGLVTRRRPVLLLLAWIGAALAAGSLLMTLSPSAARLVTVAVPVCLISAWALWSLVRLAQRWLPAPQLWLRIGWLLVLLTAGTNLWWYFQPYRLTVQIGWEGDFPSTDLGRSLHGLDPATTIVLLEYPPDLAQIPALPFLTHTRPPLNLDPAALTLWTPPPAPWLVVAPYEYRARLDGLLKRFPAGVAGCTRPLDQQRMAVPRIWPLPHAPAAPLYCWYGQTTFAPLPLGPQR